VGRWDARAGAVQAFAEKEGGGITGIRMKKNGTLESNEIPIDSS
jgi:hypothetical protein